MRVALCFSGLPRLEQNCLEYQFGCYDAVSDLHVFGHFWNGFPGGNDLFASELSNRIAPKGRVIKIDFSEGYTADENLTFRYYPESAWTEFNRRPQNTIIMHNAIARADKLRRAYESQNNFCYDLVIRSRTDIIFDQRINLRRLLGATGEYVITPRNGHYREGYCDQFAIGSSVNMTIYSSVFDKIQTYLSQGLPLHSETLLRRHLENADLPVLSGFFQTIIFRQGVPYIGTTPVTLQNA